MSTSTPGDGKSQSVKIKWVADDRELLKEPGAACWRKLEDRLYGLAFGCPCRCGYHYVPVVHGAPSSERKDWGWNGDDVNPTLTPSLLNTGCQWHGHLVHGMWTPTPDRIG